MPGEVFRHGRGRTQVSMLQGSIRLAIKGSLPRCLRNPDSELADDRIRVFCLAYPGL